MNYKTEGEDKCQYQDAGGRFSFSSSHPASAGTCVLSVGYYNNLVSLLPNIAPSL